VAAAEAQPLVEALSAGGGEAAFLPFPAAEATSVPFAELPGARFIVVSDELAPAISKLAPERWRHCRPSALHTDPGSELPTLCEFTDVALTRRSYRPVSALWR
jgi:hypothetical protein